MIEYRQKITKQYCLLRRITIEFNIEGNTMSLKYMKVLSYMHKKALNNQKILFYLSCKDEALNR